jgi:hypothetical protein
LTKEKIFGNNETRLKDVKAEKAAAMGTGCTVPTKDIYYPIKTGAFSPVSSDTL